MNRKQRRTKKKQHVSASLPAYHGTFAEALRLHQAGQLSDAERLYRQILLKDTRHGPSLHLLGVIAWQSGRHDTAVELISQAIEIIDREPAYHANLGLALQALARLDEAVASYDRALLLSPDFVEAHYNRGLALQAQGKLNEAVTSYDRALAVKPDYAEAHNNRGNALKDLGKCEAAVASYDRALALRPDFAMAHNNRGNALQTLGKLDEAVASYTCALAIDPEYAEAYNNRGNALQAQDKFDEAVACYDRALEIRPNFAEAHNNRGNALRDQGKLDEAILSYGRALALKPDNAVAHNNLGYTLHAQGKFDEAISSYDRALALKPSFAEALNNRGNALHSRGMLTEAAKYYFQAFALKPDDAVALSNLMWTLIALGRVTVALDIVRQSLRIKESTETKDLYVACVQRLRGLSSDREIRATTLRALSETWGRPGDLAGHVIDLIRGNADIVSCVARVTKLWPNRLSAQDLFSARGFAQLSADPLMLALLESAPVCDIDIERFLTMARRALLEAAVNMSSADSPIGSAFRFHVALARQCFINEYVYFSTAEEIQEAHDLKARLASAAAAGTDIPVLWLTAVASYYPLWTITHTVRLLDREWPTEIGDLLVQQVREPMEEAEMRATIPRLTDIESVVSLGVQAQYEENPYPRWIKMAPRLKAGNVIAHLSRQFPLVHIERPTQNSPVDLLVAGCGTGQHPIGTAQQFPDARVLAIDLSISSLAYAKRKTQEMELTSIEYAQADLLKLGTLGRTFDVIESSGVLHHLEDPWAGWRALLAILRPGGFMSLGLYSAIARREITQQRKLIAERGYGSSADEIRRWRQYLLSLNQEPSLAQKAGANLALSSQDFFTISGCRDLLFHVKEHHVMLPDVESFLRENGLTFIGFEIERDVLAAYTRRFPNDPAGINLGQWHVFENEHPATFTRMYQFWVQNASVRRTS